MRRIRTLDGANQFSVSTTSPSSTAALPFRQRSGTAFISCRHRNLELIFTQRYERTVDQDNTVRFHNLVMQLERAEWRPTLAGCKVIIHQHLDQTLTLTVAGHRIGHYSAQGKLLTPLTKNKSRPWKKTLRGKVTKPAHHYSNFLPNPAHCAGFALHRLYGY